MAEGSARKPVKPKEIAQERRDILSLDGKILGNPDDYCFATGTKGGMKRPPFPFGKR